MAQLKHIKFHKGFFSIYLLVPLMDQAIISISNFSLTILLVSMTQLEMFGEIAYSTTISLIGLNLMAALIVLPMNTLAVGYENAFKSYLSASLLIYCAAIFFVSSLYYVITVFLIGQRDKETDNLVFLLAYIAMALQDFGRRQLYLSSKWIFIIFGTLIRFLLPIATLLYLRKNSNSVTPTEYWEIVAASSGLALLVQYFANVLGRTNLAMIGTLSKEYISHGHWLFQQSLLQLLADNAIFLAAGWLLSSAQLGIWRSLQQIGGFLNPIQIALESVVAARASRQYKEKGKNGGDGWIIETFLIVSVPFIFLAFLLIVFAKPITAIVFPSVEPGMEWIGQIYCGIQVILMVKFFIVLYARLNNLGHLLLRVAVANFICAVTLAYPLERYFGLNGGVFGSIGLQLASLGFAAVSMLCQRRYIVK